MKQDVAVIGGSAAGLLTAALLAEKGLDVNVFEASKHLAAQPPNTDCHSRVVEIDWLL